MLVVEFIGTFTLIFAGAASIIASGGQNLVAIALAHGLAIGLMVAAAGHISGGVFNPAITCGLLASGKMPIGKGIAYIVAQLLGAVAAGAILKGILPARAVDAVNLGTPAVGGGVGVGGALAIELILTFFLMFVIFGTAIDARGPSTIAGLAIGLTITMDILAAGPYTGAAVNPARTFGTALPQMFWADHWIYWVGPIAGAVLAALLYNYVLLPFQEEIPKREPEPAPRTTDR